MKAIIIAIICILPWIFLWSYELEIGAVPTGACFTDLNNDGYVDMIIGHHITLNNVNPNISILLNDGTGHFTVVDESITNIGYEDYLYLHDLNNDGTLDLIAQAMTGFNGTGYDHQTVRVYYGFSLQNHTFVDYNIAPQEAYMKVIFIDLPNNEHALCRVSNWNHNWTYIRLHANGTPYPQVTHNIAQNPFDIVAADLNNDGTDEVIIANSILFSYWTWNGSGFTETPFVNSPYFDFYIPYIGDLDGDGVCEFIANYPLSYNVTALRLYSLPGLALISTLDNPSRAHGKLLVEDFNNDDNPELLYLLNLRNPLYVNDVQYALMFNYLNGSFTDPSMISVGSFTENSYAADVDNDGYNDLVQLTHGYPGILNISYNDRTGHFRGVPAPPVVNVNQTPAAIKLSAYPNPFNHASTITYDLAKSTRTKLEIYNLKGQKIRTIFDGQQAQGKHSYQWDGTNEAGRQVTSGLYYSRLSANGQTAVFKLALLK